MTMTTTEKPPGKVIRFRFSAEKAKAAILFMLERPGRHELHELLKACYFADKRHLNEFGRPVFGATYKAMKFGPVPVQIYEMLKGEPYWLAELALQEFPWRLNGFVAEKTTNEIADLDVLSASDVEALTWGHDLASAMTFGPRNTATHGKDWQSAHLGAMAYEDMLEEAPDRDEKIQYLRETAPHMKL